MQYNCVSVLLSVAGFNTQAFTRVLCIMGHVLLLFHLGSSCQCETEVLVEPQEILLLLVCFFLIAACFPRCKFGFSSADTEVNGQD